MPRNKTGFTLIELLVVIVIIATLAGVLLPAVMGLGHKQKRLETIQFIKNLQIAVVNYLAKNPVLGEEGEANGISFINNPAKYLIHDPAINTKSKTPYLVPQLKNLGYFDGTVFNPADDFDTSTHFLDAWNSCILFTVNNKQGASGKWYTDKIEIYSGNGEYFEPGDTIPVFAKEEKEDHIIFSFTLEESRWNEGSLVHNDNQD